jgi:phosphoribosylformylglycinamidine synthase
MCIGGGVGAELELREAAETERFAALFGETPSRYVLEVAPGDLTELRARLGDLPHETIGRTVSTPDLVLAGGFRAPVDELRRAWREPLDW